MKKLFKFLSLGMLFTLASCGTNNTEPASTPDNSKGESDGEIIREVADDLFDYFGANRNNTLSLHSKRSLDPVPDGYRTGPEREMPPVYLYLAGVLSDIDGVDISNKAFEFYGEYQAKFGSEEYTSMNINLAINTKLDKTNNKVNFSCKFDYEMINPVFPDPVVMNDKYIFIDINYDFSSKTLGDFKLIMDQMGTLYCFQVENGEAYYSGGTSFNEDDVANLTADYNTRAAAFETLTVVTATGELLLQAKQAYVNTQKYADVIINGADSGIRIKPASN